MRTAVAIKPVSVMISSQCKRSFPAGERSLTEIRQTLRDRIEAAELFGQKLFTVWINEDAPAAGIEENSWEACLTQAAGADILIVLDTGHAGWVRTAGDVGICHAELMTAQNSAPAKVRRLDPAIRDSPSVSGFDEGAVMSGLFPGLQGPGGYRGSAWRCTQSVEN